MKILITDKCHDRAREILSEIAEVDVLPTMSEDEYVANIDKYDAIIIRSSSRITKRIMDASTHLKVIGRAGVGVDNIDVAYVTEKGIIVVNSPNGNTNAAAEHTLAMMLSMARNIPEASKKMHDGYWDKAKLTGVELSGKTLGVIGFGKIGSYVATVAKAMGMDIIVYDPFAKEEQIKALDAKLVKDLDEFWHVPDFITIHVPKTKDTLDLINKDTISKMKKGVRIVNCARGGIVNEADLREALDSDYVAGVALDVFCDEKDITTSPLYGCEKNLVMTPHLGATTYEAQIRVAEDVANQIKTVLQGGKLPSSVNGILSQKM